MSELICMDAAARMPEEHDIPDEVVNLNEARNKIASTIGASPEEIYFMTGGAEAGAAAVKAAVSASGKDHPHILTTMLENTGVFNACRQMEEQGTGVTYLYPISTGRVEVAMIENELKTDTCLISVTAANSETGTSEPFTGIGTMCDEKEILFHLDASYGYGRMPINVERSHIDMLSVDASCFGGPKGTGFLYVRSGTEAGQYVEEDISDVGKIGRMALVAEKVNKNVAEYMQKVREIRDHLCRRIFAEIEDVELYGNKDHHLVNHLEVRIKNVSAAVVQKQMAASGIMIGIGTGSDILRVIGKSQAEAAETVRFSLTSDVEKADAERAVDLLKEIVTGQRVI